MSGWRSNQSQTGSNNIPLGNRRRFGGEDETPPPRESRGRERSRSPIRAKPDADNQRVRKRRNRWGPADENKAAGLMGLPTAIMSAMTQEQKEAYVLHLRIEEISQKLRIDDVVPSDNRSPSPAPAYDNFGRRNNTREMRYRRKLEEERHQLVEKALKTIPEYHPPADYRRPAKTQEKVYVPVNDYPEINFIGLLIGPRGNTLKTMEQDSGAKIAIRGKGSVKEGKGRSDAAHTSNQEEDLHCLIMADSEDKVNKAKQLINNVIETAASIPEGQNELKRNQLRELAALNGTLRDDENQACQNCGQIGHRKYDCPEKQNYTATMICRVCGNSGHMGRDCPERQQGGDWRGGDGPPRRPPAIRNPDNDFNSLMSGRGDGPPQRIEAGTGGYGAPPPPPDDGLKPWERGPPAAGAPGGWNAPRQDSNGAAPWASGGGRGGGNNNYGYPQHSNYGMPTAPAAQPWAQGGAPPAAPGYGYPPQTDYGYQAAQPWGHQGGYNAVPPPPPSGSAPPPPPPSAAPPPPPPSNQPPPPPPRY
ncbi:branchpoint-bridging protein [Venturia nashicola]|nr:branchpoint-bridging protein [Venturia nashicola]